MRAKVEIFKSLRDSLKLDKSNLTEHQAQQVEGLVLEYTDILVVNSGRPRAGRSGGHSSLRRLLESLRMKELRHKHHWVLSRLGDGKVVYGVPRVKSRISRLRKTEHFTITYIYSSIYGVVKFSLKFNFKLKIGLYDTAAYRYNDIVYNMLQCCIISIPISAW